MDKREEILNSALHLFVEFGFHGTPTSRIAREAGVANGTLFHYFKTKDELIVALYAQVKSRLSEYMYAGITHNAEFREILYKIYENTLNWAQQNPQEFYFMQQFNTSPFLTLISPDEIARQAQPHLDLLELAIQQEVFRPLPVQLLFILINNYIYGVSQYFSIKAVDAAQRDQLISDTFENLWKMLT